MAKQSYTVGQILTSSQMSTLQANDYNQTVSAKVASYVLEATDAGTRITMSNASATTVTVNTALFTAGDTLTITNIGAGVCTVTAGTATVSTAGSLALNQYDSGTLYFTSTGVSIWNGANPGDITGVTAGTGISGGGTSGTVTVTNSMATAIDAKGDLIAGTGADAFSRLAVGANTYLLTADSAEATGLKWAAPAATASGLTFITGAAFSAATTINVNNCFSATYQNYRIVLNFIGSANNWARFRMRVGGVDNTTSNYRYAMNSLTATGTTANLDSGNPESFALLGYNVNAATEYQGSSADFYAPFASTITSVSGIGTQALAGMNFFATHNVASSFDGITIYASGGTFTGNYRIYGYQNS